MNQTQVSDSFPFRVESTVDEELLEEVSAKGPRGMRTAVGMAQLPTQTFLAAFLITISTRTMQKRRWDSQQRPQLLLGDAAGHLDQLCSKEQPGSRASSRMPAHHWRALPGPLQPRG